MKILVSLILALMLVGTISFGNRIVHSSGNSNAHLQPNKHNPESETALIKNPLVAMVQSGSTSNFSLTGVMKEKRRYLVVQFDDPDADIKGAVNFKLDNKELLESVIQTLGTKAKLTQRGDAFYRPRTTKTDI